jgi:tetratricopeptide (TPR) repeat protein
MKKRGLTTIIVSLFLFNFLQAQTNTADDDYIKAMTSNDPCQRIQLLKAYVAKYAGQGTKYENFAYAQLCLTLCPTKTPKETIDYGEKALAAGGLDDLTKCQLLINLSVLYSQTGQSLEKAKSCAIQVVELARANKDKEAGTETADQWNKLIGAGYFALGQAQEKAKDDKGAVDSYVNSYNILKNPQILASLKKVGKALYEAKMYADAEKAFKAAYSITRDFESCAFYAKSLYRNGKNGESLAYFKEAYGKQKNGEIAYNIGIILAKDSKTNPALANEAIKYLLEASFLSPANSQQALSLAESLFFTANKDLKYNENIKQIEEINKKIDELTKTYNTKFEGKNEDELSDAEKREMKTLLDSIEVEKKNLQKLESDQNLSVAKFNKLLDETKQRLGIK